jgi:hypothetical protein
LACSEAPNGHAQWSLRLLADRLVELEMVETISYCSVGLILKKNELQPHRKRQWCISAITSEFLARLEIIIRIYLLPYNELRPVVCFDEHW